jgi:hypothetical protein
LAIPGAVLDDAAESSANRIEVFLFEIERSNTESSVDVAVMGTGFDRDVLYGVSNVGSDGLRPCSTSSAGWDDLPNKRCRSPSFFLPVSTLIAGGFG